MKSSCHTNSTASASNPNNLGGNETWKDKVIYVRHEEENTQGCVCVILATLSSISSRLGCFLDIKVKSPNKSKTRIRTKKG